MKKYSICLTVPPAEHLQLFSIHTNPFFTGYQDFFLLKLIQNHKLDPHAIDYVCSRALLSGIIFSYSLGAAHKSFEYPPLDSRGENSELKNGMERHSLLMLNAVLKEKNFL